MKIIGQTHEGFLISSTKNEIANLLGFYYGGEDGCPKIEAGMELAVGKMYAQLYALKNNEKLLSQMAAKLRAVADVLELNDPLVTKLTEIPEVKF